MEPSSGRRGETRSNETEISRSTSPVEKPIETIQLEESLNSKYTLKRFLSINSVISTSSSFAQRQQAAIGTKAEYRAIGAGTCAKVFEVTGTAYIFKVAKHPGKETDSLWNDYLMHLAIAEQFDKIERGNIAVHVPKARYFASEDDQTFWEENMERFPAVFRQHSNVICAERILPLAKPIRESLVDQYCRQDLRSEIKADPANKDCLVRIYLGKRRANGLSRFFQLRNFSLHLNQMEELELDVFEFATEIAKALAIVHWAAHVDANDVEFVLGSAPDKTSHPAQNVFVEPTFAQALKLAPNTSTWGTHVDNFTRRTTHIWLLDFNRCKMFPLNERGLKQLTRAFFDNDPYYPLPSESSEKDQKLWEVFRREYLKQANRHVGNSTYQSLPGAFMDMVVEEQRERMSKKA